MAELFLLLVVSLLGSVEGSEHRLVASGSDLLLETKTAEVGPGDDFIWRFNTTSNLVKFRLGSEPLIKYKERTVFSKQNYSLLLRNMQHSDSGNYKARVSGLEDKTVTEYTIRVQDPVSPVTLTVTPTNPGCYNFTVTCRTVDSQINGTFQCDNKMCRLLDQTDLKGSSLIVFLKQTFIICNHSNQVSLEMDVKDIRSYCDKSVYNRTTAIINIIRITLAALLVVVCSLIAVIRKCKRKSKQEQAVHEVPQVNQPNSPVADSSDESATL